MQGPKKIRIGDLLVASGDITNEQLNAALTEQKETGAKLGRILVDKHYVDEDRLLGFLSEQLGIPYIDLSSYMVDEEMVAKLPETFARRYRAIVLAEDEVGYLVGMADPVDIFAFDEISRQLKAGIHAAVVKESDLLALLDSAYRRTNEIINFASELDGELSVDEFSLASFEADNEESTPVARLLHSILEDAVQVRASDVHIEPDENVLRLRMRVDGVLQEQVLNERRIHAALVSRVKLMAGLDISEKRLPQDGRFDSKLSNKTIEVRLSTLPTTHGECIVMRLADQNATVAQLEQSGMSDDIYQRVVRLLERPNGLILVTGPTGSGKTTTLYGALAKLNTAERKIITVEDPVELQLERINQVQVKPKIGLTFAQVLRATLRQDPDVLLVGEIRDSETAEIALRAAMTGHLVLSTLHTNDAASSVMRLLDMGIEGYMVASSVRAIIAQRLVRRLCDHCKRTAPPTTAQQAWLDGVRDAAGEASEFYEAVGCNQCHQAGYVGRVGVFELLEIDRALANALRAEDASEFARLAAMQPGHRSLTFNALDRARAGITSLDEVIGLAGYVEEEGGDLAAEAASEPASASLEERLRDAHTGVERDGGTGSDRLSTH